MIKIYKKYKLWICINILVYLLHMTQSLAPLKIQKLNKITKYQFQNFIYLNDHTQKQQLAYLSIPMTRILSTFLKNLPKTQKSLQIINLSGSGLFQLILLTEPNNFDNKLVIIKNYPNQYTWVRKNIYVNGLQKQVTLLHGVLSDKNIVQFNKITAYQPIDVLINPKTFCQNCQKQYHIGFTLQKLIQTYKFAQKDASITQLSLHIFIKISSLYQAFILKKSLYTILQKYVNIKIQLILQLTTNISIQSILPQTIPQYTQNTKIYNLNLKINQKSLSLLFRQIKYEITNVQHKYNKYMQYQHNILQEGIYYVTQTNSLFKK